MSRWEAGPKVYLLCGVIFSVVGVMMLVVCGVTATHMDYVMTHGRGDVQLLPLIFGVVGVICVLVSVILAVVFFRSAQKKKRLLERGEYVIANITGFPIDYRMTVNGRPTYRIECSYQDPRTGVLHIFQSENLFIDPAYCVNAETVRVYVDRERDYKDYYVDAAPLLPEIRRH
jgi:uncharacterized membrane protein